ncbi:MAG: hypothetical protein OEV87_05420 [Phycisphaerae bacterium]|nr:hypothetical protein [Phycisphaerae bacterium]
MRQSIVFLIAITVALNVTLTGCNRQARQKGPDEMTSAQAAMEADCVVHYFKSNGSAYMTRQQHRFNPEAGFFEASSMEPTGKVKCSLVRDSYNSSGQEQKSLSDLPDSFWNKNLATALFYSFCAGGEILNTGSMVAGEDVKIEGQWYKSFKPAWPTDVDVIILRSLASARVERIELTDPQDDVSWMIRCYNCRYSAGMEKSVPRTIDVYDTENGVASKKLMIRFDYKDIRKITPVRVQN